MGFKTGKKGISNPLDILKWLEEQKRKAEEKKARREQAQEQRKKMFDRFFKEKLKLIPKDNYELG